MFYKKREFYRENEYSVIYESDYDIIDIIKLIEESEHAIKGISVEDDADVGLKTFGGTYSFDKFYELYKQYGACINKIRVEFYDIPVSMSIYDDGYISMLCHNQDFDLEDIISEKKRTI